MHLQLRSGARIVEWVGLDRRVREALHPLPPSHSRPSDPLSGLVRRDRLPDIRTNFEPDDRMHDRPVIHVHEAVAPGATACPRLAPTR